jgi:hypothetical protein
MQLVTDYVNEIIIDLKKNEHINHPKPQGLDETQTLINESCRSLVVDWLVDVSTQYKLSDDSLFLAVNLLDRYISKKKIKIKEFQLIACGALFIASKFEEIYPPEIIDFCLIMNNAFSRNDILRIEYDILNTLEFDILSVSPLVFLKRFLEVSKSAIKTLALSYFILEISLLEVKCLNYMPSLLAASCLYLSRKLSIRIEEIWNEDLEFYTGYSVNQMEDCIVLLYKILKCIPNNSLCSSKNKYSDKKYLEIAKEYCKK